MSYSRGLERALLQECSDWRFGAGHPGKDVPLQFPEAVHEFQQQLRELASDEERQWEILMEHVEIARDRGWIKLLPVTHESVEISIEPGGLDRLDWHFTQDLRPRLIAFLSTSLGIVLTSLIIPVMAAVLTVLAINYFGIDEEGGGSASEISEAYATFTLSAP